MSNCYAAFDEYGLRHLPRHLIRAGRWPNLTKTLTDFDFLEAKCGALSVYDLEGDYRLALAAWRGEVEDLLIRQLEEMHKHVWTEVSALSHNSNCVTQQLANRLKWSTDDYLRNQANKALERCQDAGRPLLRTLLPNPNSNYRTQRILGLEVEDTIGMAMIGCDLVLWSNTGKLRVLKHGDSVIRNEENPVPPMPLQQLTGKEEVLVAVSGRVIHYWEKRPEGKLITKTLPFAVLQVALACQSNEMVVIGQNGELAHYSFQSEDLEERRTEQLSGKGTCCAMSFNGEYWVVGTRTGQVFFCNNTGQREITKHAGAVRTVAVDPTGNRIASGGQDGVLRLTERDGSVIHSIQCDGWINDITFSADGEKVFWATESGQLMSLTIDSPIQTASVWMSEKISLEHICLLPAQSKIAEPENEIVAVVLASDHRARLVESPQNTTTSTWCSPLSGHVNYITPWREGTSILAIDAEGNRFIIDLTSPPTPPPAKRISESAGAVVASALLEGRHLITIYQDLGRSRVTRRMLVWRAWQEKTLLSNPRVTDGFTHATFSPDLRTFVVVRSHSASDYRIEAYDATTLKKIFEIDWNVPDCRTMAVSNSARHILVASLLNEPPQLIAVSDNPASKTIVLPLVGCQGAAFSGTGSELLVVDRDGKALFFPDVLQDERCESLGTGMICCDLSSDARWILLGDSDGQVILIDRMAATESLKIHRAFLPWKLNYCRVYPQRQWVVLGGHGNLQVLKWN